MEQQIMKLISYSGEAKSKGIEAVRLAEQGSFDEAEKLINDAEENLNQAHQAQANFLVEEANGKDIRFSMLLTHAQDHMMNAITTIDLVKELIKLWKAIKGVNKQ